jgi:hypothetical protein
MYRSKIDKMALARLKAIQMLQLNFDFIAIYYLDIQNMEAMVKVDQIFRL